MLAVDIGNSRIKWGLWDNQQFTLTGSAEYNADTLCEIVERQWQNLPLQSGVDLSVWVANVAGGSMQRVLMDCLQQYAIEPEFLRSTQHLAGVHNSYPEPMQLGVDRWAALLGAHALYPGEPVCIIDCGTAVTVDLMDAGGQHLGGRIMPGLDMMRRALQHSTVAIDQVAGNNVEYANNTADAVTSGTLQMLRAAIQDVCEYAEKRLDETVKIIITGGSSELMMPLLKSSSLYHEPNLVLRGLVVAAEH